MSERKRIDEEPGEGELRYRALVASAPFCIYEVDLEGRVMNMNAAGLKTLGMNDDEITGKPLLECVANEDRARVQGRIEEAFSGATVEFEFTTHTPRGKLVLEQRLAPLVTRDGIVEGLVGITRDVTGHRARDEALRAEHELREELFRTAQVIIIILSRDGQIIDFNPFMEQLSGYPIDEVWGKDWFDTFLPERDRDRIRSVFEEALAGAHARGYVNPIVTRDGRELDIEWYSSLLTEPNGSVHGALGIGHDVTERKRSEQALAASEQKLRELSGRLLSSREEETRRLSRELHDDLGQRLTLLGMELDQVGESLCNSGAGADTQRKVSELSDVVNALTDQVSDISRRLHPSIVEHLGLTTALARECAAAATASGKSIVLDADETVPRHPPQDAAMCLYRVAQEAIRNALTHSGSDRVELELASEEGGIRLSIRDWGQGFEAKTERADWGLGLVSMAERSRLAGGKLTIDSQPGRGTVISCWVPMREI